MEMIKFSPTPLSIKLLGMINTSWTVSYVTDEWKFAIVLPISQKETRRTLKIVEESVYQTPAIKFTLKLYLTE